MSSSRPRDSSTIRFILDGETIELQDVPPTRTVLQFLREDRGRTGTKEGCAEGDCGACTVVVAELVAGEFRVRAINSCIQFLATLDGKELFTVESLKGVDGTLHPVQQALVEQHGSQCGFCTPGFAMSMFALYKNKTRPTRVEVDDALAGNLCRCTGYRPIVDAATAMYDEGARRDPRADWRLAVAGGASDAQREAKHQALGAIARKADLAMTSSEGSFHAPRSVGTLAALVESMPDATILAGGTDIGLWVTKQHRRLRDIIYTAHVPELNIIETTTTHIEIGAAVTVTDAMVALIEHYPMLDELFLRYGSPPIRNAGTLGGNVANGSPIGDSMPALLALGATLVLQHGDKTRELALEQFYLGYQQTALAGGEFLRSVRVPLPATDSRFRTYKVSKRFDQDISAVCGAFFVQLADDDIVEARIGFGGMAAIPSRAASCEAALTGRLLVSATIEAAVAALIRDFQPITDARASEAYRLQVACNLLRRFYADIVEDHPGSLYAYGRA